MASSRLRVPIPSDESESPLKITETDLPDVLLVEPDVHRDARGFFLETWHAEKYARAGIDVTFVQDNHSRSSRGTLRGMHVQPSRPQGKLIRVSEGEIYDVALDVRRGSPFFGRHVGVHLSADNFRQLWIPAGYAHGFCVVSETAEIQYKCTELYDPKGELTLAWNDPEFAIRWPVDEPLLSAKDSAAVSVLECLERLPTYSAPSASTS